MLLPGIKEGDLLQEQLLLTCSTDSKLQLKEIDTLDLKFEFFLPNK